MRNKGIYVVVTLLMLPIFVNILMAMKVYLPPKGQQIEVKGFYQLRDDTGNLYNCTINVKEKTNYITAEYGVNESESWKEEGAVICKKDGIVILQSKEDVICMVSIDETGLYLYDDIQSEVKRLPKIGDVPTYFN